MYYYIVTIAICLSMSLKASFDRSLLFAGTDETRNLIRLKDRIDSGAIEFEAAGTEMREILLRTSKESSPVLHSTLSRVLTDTAISFSQLMSTIITFLRKMNNLESSSKLYQFPLTKDAHAEIEAIMATMPASVDPLEIIYTPNNTLFMPMAAGQEIGLLNFFKLMAHGINPGGLVIGSSLGHGSYMESGRFLTHDKSHHTTVTDLLKLWSIYFDIPMVKVFKNLQAIGSQLEKKLQSSTIQMRATQCLFGLTYLIHEVYIEYFAKFRVGRSRRGLPSSEIAKVAQTGIPTSLSIYLQSLYQILIQQALGTFSSKPPKGEILESLNCQFRLNADGEIEIISFTQPLYGICSDDDFQISLKKMLKRYVRVMRLELVTGIVYSIKTNVVWSMDAIVSARFPSAKRIRGDNIMDVTFTITSTEPTFQRIITKRFTSVENIIDWQLVDIIPFLEIFQMMDLPQSDGTSKRITVESSLIEKAAVYKNALEQLGIILDDMIGDKVWTSTTTAS